MISFDQLCKEESPAQISLVTHEKNEKDRETERLRGGEDREIVVKKSE